MTKIILSVVMLATYACAQTAVLESGDPVVRCDSRNGPIQVHRATQAGKIVFRFTGMDLGGWAGHKGNFIVAEDKVAFMPESGNPFIADRKDSFSVDNGRFWLTIKTASGKQRFVLMTEKPGGGVQEKAFAKELEPCVKLEQSLITDFPAGTAEFDRVTASLHPAPPPEPPKPKVASLKVVSDPGGAQVYVDGVFKGETSDNGDLIIESTPGEHDLRLRRTDYKEWNGKVTLTGERTEQKVDLVKRGPEPLSEADVEEALTNGMTTARLGDLVKQYGVSFAMTPDIDKQLRAKGADDALLLTIAENKR